MKVKLLRDIQPRWSSLGRDLLFLALAFLPFTALAQTTELTGSGTSDEPYLISSADDWNAFATKVSGGETTACAKLTQDIETVSTMIGTSQNQYAGTFDGDGHTLNVNCSSGFEQYVAPFRYVKGATIRNLRVTGKTYGTDYASGLIGRCNGATITGCDNNVSVTSSGGSEYGGYVGIAYLSVTITNSRFSGAIEVSRNTKCGGFIGSTYGNITLANCLLTASFDMKSYNSYTFVRKAINSLPAIKITNCYYKNALYAVQGTAVTDDRLASGEMTWILQNGLSKQFWGQTLTGNTADAQPVFTTDASKRVYKVTYQYDDGYVLATQYSNATMDKLPDVVANKTLTLNGETFTAPTTLSQDLTVTVGEDRTKITPSINDAALDKGAILTPTVSGLPDDYKGTITYTSDAESVVSVNDTILTGKAVGEANITATFAGTDTYKSATTTFKVTVSINKDDLDGEGTEATPYLIKTATGWNEFAQLVASGNTTAYAKLANDIDLGEGLYSGMIGTSAKPYSGTFDGQGHTVTVNYTASQQYVAPFRYISGATIKNLHTAGTFKVSNKFAAGIVASATGSASTIENCRCSVVITSSVKGDGTHGGLVAVVNNSGTVAIKDCILDGSITGSSTTNCGALIGWVDKANTGSTTITNCLQDGTFSLSSSDAGSYTFSRTPDNVTVSNSYYLNALGKVNDGATQVTTEQLSNGEVAYKLQAGRSEQVWGQAIGTDDMPQLTSDEDKHVYNNVYGSENVYDNYVVINEDKDNAGNIAANNNGRVKVVRSFDADTWNTLVLPFALTTDEVNTAFGDDVKVAYFTNETENTIELNTNDDTKAIEANTPVLIRVSSTVSNPTFSNRDIVSSESPQVSGSNGISFIGSYAASYTIQDGEYFISGDKLWKSNGSSTIKATRGYFIVPGGQQAKLHLIINGEDVTTGISGVRSEELGVRSYGSAVYAISGQKVADSLDEARKARLKAGVYIVNGKKIIIK